MKEIIFEENGILVQIIYVKKTSMDHCKICARGQVNSGESCCKTIFRNIVHQGLCKDWFPKLLSKEPIIC